MSTCTNKKVYALTVAPNTVAYSFTTGTGGDLPPPRTQILVYRQRSDADRFMVATIATRSLAEPIFTGAAGNEMTPSGNRAKMYIATGDNYSVFLVDTATNRMPFRRFVTSHPPVARPRYPTIRRSTRVSELPCIAGLPMPSR